MSCCGQKRSEQKRSGRVAQRGAQVSRAAGLTPPPARPAARPALAPALLLGYLTRNGTRLTHRPVQPSPGRHVSMR